MRFAARSFATWPYGWYYPTVIGAVALIGALSSFYVYTQVSSAVRQSLLEQASTIAYALEPSHITSLTGTELDLANPDYRALKERLMRIRHANPAIRFAYLMGYRNGTPYFIADSEPENSPDYSPPGQAYREASATLRSAFSGTAPVLDDISTDRWGTWLTAATPIVDPATGRTFALMGIDMNADAYYRIAFLYAALPAMATVFILALLAVGFMLRKRERRFLEFKSELVSIASHEIRTPLSGIRWLAQTMLRESSAMPPKLADDLHVIEKRSEDLLRTVHDLLSMSAPEGTGRAGAMRPVRCAPLLSSAADTYALALRERSLQLRIEEADAEDAVVFGDERMLTRIFSNLLANAVKYSKPGAEILLAYSRTERSVVFRVHDRGIGIPASDIARIFEGGYRSENARASGAPGVGMGLSHVKSLVELHGGRIWCESAPESGTTFFVELPLIRA